MRVAIAILIAFTSTLGAGVAWRASLASGQAGGAEAKALDDAMAREQRLATIKSRVYNSVDQFIRGEVLAAQAASAAREARSADGAEAAYLHLQARSLRKLAADRKRQVEGEVLLVDGKPSIDRMLELELKVAKQDEDLEFRTDFQKADDLKRKSENLIALVALLIAGSLFFTFAQVTKSKTYIYYLGGGLLVLTTGIVFLVALEMA
jgi:hypothetical protein